MPLQVEVRRVGEVAVLKCTGRIVNGEESQLLQRRLTELMPTDRHMLLDLGEVTFLDSSGLGLLVRMAGVMRSARGDLKLCRVTAEIDHVLKITNLKQVLEAHPSEVEAVAAFYEHGRNVGARSQGPKLVCVDASEDVLALVRELARQAGYSPVTTSNALDARVLIKAIRPVLVVLGPGVTQEIRRSLEPAFGKTPVAALDRAFAELSPAEASDKMRLVLREAQGAC